MIYELLRDIILSNDVKYITLSIYGFNDLLLEPRCLETIEIITNRYVLQTGHFASLFGTKIYVSKEVNKENIKVGISNESDKISWSPNISIDLLKDLKKLDKILNNKAFW